MSGVFGAVSRPRSFDLATPCAAGRSCGAGLLAVAALVAAGTLGSTDAARAEQPSWLSAFAAASHQSGAAPRSAAPKAGAAADHGDDHVDTEHIFGFTMGSDIGEKGEIELEIENVGRLGKRSGTYFGFSSLNLIKFTLTDNFRIAPGVAWGAHKIKNVPGFEDRQQASFEGAVLELRYKLLDREVMPFGLTLHVQPGWSRTAESTGFRTESYGSEFALLADKEIIKNQLWAAVNLWYGIGAAKDLTVNTWSHDSDVEIHAALSTRVSRSLIIGGEMRYMRTYDGMGLDTFKGEALYIGPTFSWHIAKNAGLSGTVNFQVAGKAVGDPRSLDLENFERAQALLRFNLLF